MKLHDWRLLPIAVGTWTGAVAGTSGRPWVAVLCAAVALLVAAGLWRRTRWIALGLVACALLAALSGLLAHQRATSTLAALAEDRAIVQVEFQVVSEPRPTSPNPPMPPSATAMAEVTWVEGRGERVRQRLPVVMSASGELGDAFLGLRPGGRYLADARLAPAEPGDSIVAFVRVRELGGQTARPGPLQAAAAALRDGLRRSVAHSPPLQRALVPSLVVGDTTRVDDAMADDFRDTGLTHLMAVSGANLALMLGVILAFLRLTGVRGWTVRLVAVGGVGMFVIICGPEPSVQRAAVMGLVSLVATGVGKGRRSVRALSVAITTLMAMDPWLCRAPGFWLSVAACFGIVVLGPIWIQALTRWAPRWLAEALAIPLSAQLATQPIVTWLSGEVSLVGVIANVLAGPFVGPTTVLGFAAACLFVLPWVSVVLGWAAGWASQPILWIAQWGAALPASTINWQQGPIGIVLLAGLCIALVPLLTPVLRRAWASALLLVALILSTAIRPSAPGWPGDWSVAFCDVGQGDATVLRADSTTAVLVDVGPEPEPVLDCLRGLGVRSLAMVVLTHYHADHVGGFAGVAARYEPELVLVSPLASPEAAARAVEEAVGADAIRGARPGERLTVGDVTWSTISAWQPTAPVTDDGQGESAVENDASIVGVAEVGELTVMLAGDVEPGGQRHAMREARRLGIDIAADVLKLPHHGSSRQDSDFFAATGAHLAVASSAEGNAYGHPAPSALELARSHGMVIARTDEEGSVAVGLHDDALVVRRSGK
ncbi:MAG: DUF4131 domain-containing protein [Propionibacterium sp.]|nr:DUF4131 domain-containing protein [Propionibacterium sp.]